MEATINREGVLIIKADSGLESYALEKWISDNYEMGDKIKSQHIVIDTSIANQNKTIELKDIDKMTDEEVRCEVDQYTTEAYHNIFTKYPENLRLFLKYVRSNKLRYK